MKLEIFLLISTVACFDDPGVVLMDCIDGGDSVNTCSERAIETIIDSVETGIPELGLPPMDPMSLEQLDFRFFNLSLEVSNISQTGFKNFKLEKSVVDKDSRAWHVEMSIPRSDAVGVYKMTGTLPPNIDLGTSSGDQRFSMDNAYAIVDMKLGRNGSKIEIVEMDLLLKLEDMHVEMDCLFPRRNGKCCPRKYLKSCNTILAKTVLRFINKDGKNFVEQFQPEISRKIRPILENYFSKAIASTDATYLIN